MNMQVLAFDDHQLRLYIMVDWLMNSMIYHHSIIYAALTPEKQESNSRVNQAVEDDEERF